MHFISRNLHTWSDVPNLAINPDLYIPLTGYSLKKLPIVPLTILYHRCQDFDFCPNRIGLDGFYNFIRGLAYKRFTGCG